MTYRQAVATLTLLAIAGCGKPADSGQGHAVALDRPAAAVLVRLPRAGGRPSLYHLPDLADVDWKAQDRLGAIDQLVGATPEPPQVIVREQKGALKSIGLQAGLSRVLIGNAAIGALGADGNLYAVDSTGAAWTVGRRTPDRYRSRYDGIPDMLWSAAAGVLVGYDSSAQALEVFGPSDTVAVRPIEAGAVAATQWADLVAVAADSAVWLYDPQATRAPARIKAGPGATGVAFSPSGHQLYVSTSRGSLIVIDRFGRKVHNRITLPGPATEVRAGPFGRWLLVRPARGQEVWVVDLERNRVLGSVSSSWDADLPLISASNVLVVRDGKDVVAHDLSSDGLPETGRIQDGAGDLWVSVPWSPDRAAEVVAATPDDSAASAGEASSGDRIYLQVSSSRNPDWATELVRKLGEAGLSATVLRPATESDPYRVVLGPYPSREAAEENGRTLGMPYFVITLPAASN